MRRTEGDPLAQGHLGRGLGRRAARGAASTLVTQWTRFVLQTASTIVLARLLTPLDYGLVGMVTALVGIGDALWNLGLQTATIQRRTITQGQVSFFFWLQVTLGLVLTGVACACASLIVSFYGESRLYPLVFAYSAYFALSGLVAQHLAVLSRQMRFTLMAVVDIVALAIGLAVAIVVAALGGAYWALVAQTLVTLGVRVVWYWFCSGWTPSRPRREPGIWPMLRFGLNLSLTNLLTYSGQNADNVLIGKVYGTDSLGIYSRAYNLLLLPIRQIQMPLTRVAVPVLSYLQDDPVRYRRYYHTAVSGISYLAMPLITTLAALSPEAVDILLGRKWHAVAPIFQVLAIAGTLQILRNPNSWIFTSTGHTGRQARWSLISQPLLVASFVAGIPWGVVGVAWAYTITNLVLLVPAFMWAVRDSPLTLKDVWTAGWRPIALGVAAFVASSAIHHELGHLGSWPVILVGFAATGAIMGLALLLWPSVRADLRTLRGVLGSGPLAAKGASALPRQARAGGAEPTPAGPGVAAEPTQPESGPATTPDVPPGR